MLKRLFILCLILCTFSACAHRASRVARKKLMEGWEFVRIEDTKPSDKCIYKMQDVCPTKGAECYIWFKKRAKIYGGNTVIVVKNLGGGSASIAATPIGAKVNSEQSSYIADYYDCPSCEGK